MNTDKEQSMEATRATTATVTGPTGGRRFPATMVASEFKIEDGGDWKPRVAEMLLECAKGWDEAAIEHRQLALVAMTLGCEDMAAMHHYAAQHDEMYAAEDRRRAAELVSGQ